MYSLRRENENLKADLEVLKQKNFDTIAHQIKGMFKGKQFGDNSETLNRILQENHEMKAMISRLQEQGLHVNQNSV